MIVSMIVNHSGTNISVPFLSVLAVDLALYATYGVGMWLETRWDALPMLVGCTVQMGLVAALAVLKCIFYTSKGTKGTSRPSKGTSRPSKGTSSTRGGCRALPEGKGSTPESSPEQKSNGGSPR